MVVQKWFIDVVKYVAASFHSPLAQQRAEAIKQLRGVITVRTATLCLLVDNKLSSRSFRNLIVINSFVITTTMHPKQKWSTKIIFFSIFF